MKKSTTTVRDVNGSIIETQEVNEISDQNSVVLTIDAKGNVKPEVKVYDADPEVASSKAQQILAGLIEKYKIKLSE